MSKREYIKYREAFADRSARIPYNIYVKILYKEYDVELIKSGPGSARSFKCLGVDGEKYIFVIHEPHGGHETVGKGDHHKVLRILKLAGKIENED